MDRSPDKSRDELPDKAPDERPDVPPAARPPTRTPPKPYDQRADDFAQAIDKKAGRRRRHRQEADRGVWQWLGMFGLVGWAVAIPTIGGIALGWWIDRTWDSAMSWTLNLLVIGVLLGCWNAWHWVDREGRGSSGNDRE